MKAREISRVDVRHEIFCNGYFSVLKGAVVTVFGEAANLTVSVHFSSAVKYGYVTVYYICNSVCNCFVK